MGMFKQDINSHCANCGTDLESQSCTGCSSLYTGGSCRFSIGLCERCWLMEEDVIDQQGTNVLPERMRHYISMIEQHSRVGKQVHEHIPVMTLNL